jgi:hypothetical protein
MDNDPEGWTEVEYKEFKADDADSDSDSESESESDSDKPKMKGYQKKEYKKILFVEELLPE